MKGLKFLFIFILVSMIALTTWATMQEDVISGFWHVVSYRWGWATLGDTYFAFLTFYVWVYRRERALVPRLLWFVGIMALGNIAMASYVLLQMRSPKGLPA